MGRRTSLASLAGAKVDDVPGRTDLLLLSLPLAKLIPTRFNPRRNFGTEEQLREFGLKLKQKQLQPAVVVSRAGYLKLWPEEAERIGDVPYVIANGERRFRASQLVGRPTLDVVHHEEVANSRAEFLDAVLAENNDREDLDPIERALGIETMVVELGGADKVAKHYGKSGPWVSNQRKLLRLTPELQQLVSSGELSIRIGRDIASLPQEKQAAAWQDELDRRAAVLAAPRPRRTKDEPAPEPVQPPAPAPGRDPEPEVVREAAPAQQPVQAPVQPPEPEAAPVAVAPVPAPAPVHVPGGSAPATEVGERAPAAEYEESEQYEPSAPAPRTATQRPEPLPDIATVGAIPWRNPETVFRTIRHWMTPEDLQSLHKLMREHFQDS
ncbi:ParB/RepB/Spo0J family partition protein [Streptomyces cavernicola]|uniref:ParB/RepB/Spo0J family partition protein n=1 Tax=Streptomyces cavernicola TaxID=3043613 RepID=A0ABT6SCZ8_9ACTN|nr:ParB/RepB/Spo0J family partition protein [Streptomyces sp. B-S-A6]MDI3405819.1 ParB/RepB/Spo0J family partition protein [Streptomyces sp. B-S-A6]